MSSEGQRHPEALRGHAAMLAFSALVAGSFSLGVQAANELAPTALNAVRFVIAAVLVAVVAQFTTGLPRSAFRMPWRYLVLGGLFAIYFVLMFEGLKTAPPVSAAAVFTLTPIISAGFGYLLMRQILYRSTAVGLAFGSLGALWVIFRADLSAFLAFEVGVGEATYFVGCIMHAIYTPMVARLNRGESPVVFTFGTLVAGSVLLLIYGWGDIRAADWANLPPIVWITILYTGVAATAGSFVLLQYAALRLPSSKVMAYTYLVPSWVILWELAQGHGAPTPFVLVGVGITVGALWWLLQTPD